MLRTVVPRLRGRSLPVEQRIKTWKIVRGDAVELIAGRDKGKRGPVIKVLRKRNALVVQGVNVTRRHVRRGTRGTFNQGFWYAEAPVPLCRVALIDPTTSKPCRIHWGVQEGKKVRVAPSGAVIPKPPPPSRTEARQRVGPKDTPAEEALRVTFEPSVLNPLLKAANEPQISGGSAKTTRAADD